MKPFNIPVCSSGSLASWWLRILISSGKGALKLQPFGDAEMQAALVLQLFEDQEILPVAEVLHAGYAMRQSIGDGEFVARGVPRGWAAD